MLNNRENTAFDNFDALLLDKIIMEFETNNEIQKSIDMTANNIFTSTAAITVSVAKEKAFLNQNATSIFARLFTNKYILAFILMLFIGYLAVHFSATTIPTPPPSTVNSILPVIITEESETTDKDSLIIESEDQNSINDSLTKDEKEVIIQKSNYDSLETTTNHISQGRSHIGSKSNTRNYFEEYDSDIAKSIILKSYYDEKLVMGDYRLELQRHNLFSTIYPKTATEDNPYKYAFNILTLPLYEGTPFEKGFDNMQYIPINKRYKKSDKLFNSSKFEKGIYLYTADAYKYYYNYQDTKTDIASFFEKPENYDLLQSFYISKKEVSNADYKEFLNWVKAYNGYDTLNIKIRENLKNYSYAFNYTFHNPTDEIKNALNSNTINILPNMKSWKKGFDRWFGVYEDFYLDYDEFPIVAVSYWQALAYTDWLNWIWQSRINNQDLPYDIVIDLPYDYERELACKFVLDEQNEEMVMLNPKSDFIANLAISIVDDYMYRTSLGLFYAHPSAMLSSGNDDFIVKNESNSIQSLDNNVSEWVKEDYKTDWLPYRNYWIDILNSIGKPYTKPLLASEEYFNLLSDSNGKLVRGANWYDKRTGSNSNRLYDGMWAKTFVDPKEQHVTIGFRYVMRVRLKNEEAIKKKISILGQNLPKYDYSMEKNEGSSKNEFYQDDPPNFMFVPMGSFLSNEKTVSVQAFYAQETETSNIQWMLFLNYLIDNNRMEDLKECIPNDPDWAYKMTYETDKIQSEWKNRISFSASVLFSNKFIKTNKIGDIKITSFSVEPIVGISYKAVKIYTHWMNEIYGDIIDFRIPYESEWEWMARGGLNDSLPYAWGGPYTRDHRGIFIARFLWSDYMVKSADECKNEGYNSQEAFYNNLFGSKQNQAFTSIDSTYLNSDEMAKLKTLMRAHFPANNWGLYDICGNAAEMIEGSTKTKGGSWASPAYFLQIDKSEKWNGKPSDCVGFRLVQTYLGKKKIKTPPPGTVYYKEDLFIDQTEVRNVDWLEYMYWTEKKFGNDSEEYKSTLPDTLIWSEYYGYSEKYLRHPAYRDYPIVGVSYEQVNKYCKWRSARVNEYLYINENKEVKYHPDSVYTNIPEVYEYSLPSKEIYDDIISITKRDLENIKKKPEDKIFNYKSDSTMFSDSNIETQYTAPVFAYWSNEMKLYNILGNVAEMTSTKGIAKGGSFIQTKAEIVSEKDNPYTNPQRWLGFRCICKKKL